MITTNFASWAQAMGLGVTTSVVDEIRFALGDWYEEFTFEELDTIERAYREAIRLQLPEGVILAGDDFIVDVSAIHDGLLNEIYEEVEAIRFWPIVRNLGLLGLIS